MRTLGKIKKILKENEKILKTKYDITSIRIFGSYVKGNPDEHSDLDIIVTFKKIKSLMELVRIERELSELLGIKVDLLTEKGISRYILQDILKEAKYILQ